MQQVLMRVSDTSTAPRFELTDNPDNQAPLSFEHLESGVRVPRLGTQDLLAIAKFAAANHFTIDGFLLEDRAFTRVAEKQEEEMSGELRIVLRDKGVVQAAMVADHDWNVYVTGVRLTTPRLGTVSLLRQGVTRAAEPFDFEEFLAGAWTAVHFS